MIIQSAPRGEPRFLVTMRAHNALCGALIAAFGNARFARPEPFEPVAYAIGHHDDGWDACDAAPVFDPASGLPCAIGGAGYPDFAYNRRSPEFNEAHHPYSGLLSSMHCWGLYNERYGVTEFRVVEGGAVSAPIPADFAEEARSVLDGERARQERLTAALSADPETAPWVEPARVMGNYKAMQFIDTLSLYFHLRHADHRREETFVHVPVGVDEDAEVTIAPLADGTYRVSPWPFAGDRLVLDCPGRYVSPLAAPPDDPRAALAAFPGATQTYCLVA